jgi:SNF2 family DNA or RNA helicase
MTSKTIDERLNMFAVYLNRTQMGHKAYQFDGVRWCLENELQVRNNNINNIPKIRGGFIADEMGLGKTIMMIGLMLCNFQKQTLIVVPPVLIEQWKWQIFLTTGHKALVYHGPNKKKITKETLNKAIIVITTYNSTIVPLKKQQQQTNLLHEIEWSRIIYDEAHHLRNSKTALFQGARQLKGQIHWLVSGTPIQNKKDDFYSLCSIMRLPASFYTEQTNLPLFAKYFLLKRTKAQVGIEMPQISIKKDIIGWTNVKEMELSQQIHEDLLNCESKEKLLFMLLARQSCIMSGLLTKYSKKNTTNTSSKLDHVVNEILLNKGNNCGKLVFCHFRQEIDEIKDRLLKGGIESIATFDGRLPNSKRQQILTGGSEVLILQIQTGCEGLNLQENYSEIYFVSPHWNPAVEDQAIARCHRIGQTKQVYVKRFVMGDFLKQDQEDQEQEPKQKDQDPTNQEILSLDNYITITQERKQKIIREIMNV